MLLSETNENAPDGEIIARVLAGNKESFEIIVKRYDHYLYKVGSSYGYSHDDIEDLIQETFLQAYLHLGSFEGRASLKSWLIHIMLHQCYHGQRKMSSRMEILSSDLLENEDISPYEETAKDGEQIIENKELHRVLHDAIFQIPEDYRMVFVLRIINGMNTIETAEVLHISTENVKVRLNRARKMLQDLIGMNYDVSDLFHLHPHHRESITRRGMQAIAALSRN